MSKVKFKKPSAKRKSNRKFGHIRTKHYDCFFLLFPLIPFVLFAQWISSEYYKSLKWSDRRANKVFNHVLSELVEYDKETDRFYYDAGWTPSYNVIPFGHRKWYGKFCLKMDDYLLKEYCPEGYTKEVYKEDYYSPIIYFKEIKK